ncbi:hypothetical protein CPB97_005968 [Podila verticillata]|nr:hypothetical protein CPB97_005968 [Podila verticillata]
MDAQGSSSSLSTHPSPAQSTALAVLPPELMQEVFSYVSQSSLAMCARVNKRWSQLCTPFIWKVIERRCFRRLLDRSDNSEQTLAKNAHNVRELEFHDKRALPHLFMYKKQGPFISQARARLDLNAPMLTNLFKLRISCPVTTNGIKLPSVKDGIVALIKNNKHLRALEIASEQMYPTIRLLISTCEDLQELWISVSISAPVAKKVLDYLPQTIRKLRLNVDSDLEDETDTEDEEEYFTYLQSTTERHGAAAAPQATTPRMRKVVSLRIDGFFESDALPLLLPFLATCARGLLKDFDSPETDCFSDTRLCAALTNAGASQRLLNSRHLPQKNKSTDAEIAATISQLPQLQIIRLGQCSATGPLTVQAIATCGKRLRQFWAQDCSNLSSKDLTLILIAARNLRSFTAYSFDLVERMTITFITAQDLIAANWHAPYLKSFTCHLRVPRPDDHVPAEEVHATFGHPTVESCHEVERAVYRQIARQTSLRELELGSMGCNCSDESYVEWYSLEISMQSGLSELGPIKELQCLNVKFVNHRIGVPELEWMAENWPNLCSLDGLFMNGQPRDPAVVTWLNAHRPKWVKQR